MAISQLQEAMAHASLHTCEKSEIIFQSLLKEAAPMENEAGEWAACLAQICKSGKVFLSSELPLDVNAEKVTKLGHKDWLDLVQRVADAEMFSLTMPINGNAFTLSKDRLTAYT